MRTIFIGDIHGCIAEFIELIAKLELREDDTLVLVGDLIHKGPSSEAVLAYVQELQKRFDVIIICGNHEEKHLRWLRAEARHAETGKKNKMQHVEEYPTLHITEESELLMANTFIAKQFDNFTAVHAGIPGNLRELEYLTHNEWLEAKGKRKKALGQVMRVRFINPEGKMLSLGKQTSVDSFWADEYDGRFGTVVFGHNPFMQSSPVVFPNAFGIDLGCVHGGYLCALVVQGQQVSYEAVKAHKVYKERPSWVCD